jgi:hypothetical protein
MDMILLHTFRGTTVDAPCLPTCLHNSCSLAQEVPSCFWLRFPVEMRGADPDHLQELSLTELIQTLLSHLVALSVPLEWRWTMQRWGQGRFRASALAGEAFFRPHCPCVQLHARTDICKAVSCVWPLERISDFPGNQATEVTQLLSNSRSLLVLHWNLRLKTKTEPAFCACNS